MGLIPPTFPGERWRATHQASVDNILAGTGLSRPVVSKGRNFYNEDHWPGLRLFNRMVAGLARPGEVKRAEIKTWVQLANQRKVYDPHITIAATPQKLTPRVAMALVGGATHEAWHTLYSRRRRISVSEADNIIWPRINRVQHWGPMEELLAELGKVIEDVRIERLGCAATPVSYEAMLDLQDFVLQQETRMRLIRNAQGEPWESIYNPVSVLVGTIRDLGFGYNTELAREVMAERRKYQPEVVALVAEGALRPVLSEIQNLDEEDDLGFIRVALDVCGMLRDWFDNPPPEPQSDEGSEAGQEGPVESEHESGGDSQQDASGHLEDAAGGGPEERTGADADGDNAADESGGENEQTSSEDTGPGDAGGCAADQEPGDGRLGAGDDETGESLGPEPPASEPSGQDGQDAAGTGADHSASRPDADLVAQILDSAASDNPDLMDSSQALEAAIQAAWGKDDLRNGEAAWFPADPSLDVASLVRKTSTKKANEYVRAVLEDMQVPISYLRSRFRSMMRAQELVEPEHGLRRGKTLSERRMVDSYLDIMAGVFPSRPYVDTEEAIDLSLAVVVSRDQSSSTAEIKEDLDKVMLAITEPVENVGGHVMAFGWRFGHQSTAGAPGAHRQRNVHYDIFKLFDERFHNVRHRFACARARGGTPMSDGIEYGLMALSERKEAHRILFLVTDGRPHSDDVAVIRHQLRRAKEAGIHVIGVGAGDGAKSVLKVFPQAVYRKEPSELPGPLIQTLRGMLDYSGRLRGRRVSRQ